MADSDVVLTKLLERSAQTYSATVDGRSATQHNLKDQIELHRYLKGLEGGTSPPTSGGYLGFGVKTARIEPGGAA